MALSIPRNRRKRLFWASNVGHSGIMTRPPDTVPVVGSLTRPRRDAKVSGLSAGVADRLGLDIWFVRGLFVLLALSGGIGVPIYLWGWLLTPSDDDAAPMTRLAPGFLRWPTWGQIATIIGSSLVVSSAIAWAAPFTIWPALVVGAVWWLAARHNRGNKTSRSAAPRAPERFTHPTTPFEHSVAVWLARLDEVAALGTAPGHTAVITTHPATDAPDAERSLALTASEPIPATPAKRARLFDLCVLVLAGLSGWAGATLAPSGWERSLLALALALLVLGGGLLLRTILLRRRRPGVFITLAGVACAAALVVQTGLAPAPSNDVAIDVPPGTQIPAKVDALGVSQTVDLSAATLDHAHTLEVNAVASNVIIILPEEGASVVANYAASVVVLPSGERAGVGEFTEATQGSRVTLTIDAVLSRVEVRHG